MKKIKLPRKKKKKVIRLYGRGYYRDWLDAKEPWGWMEGEWVPMAQNIDSSEEQILRMLGVPATKLGRGIADAVSTLQKAANKDLGHLAPNLKEALSNLQKSIPLKVIIKDNATPALKKFHGQMKRIKR